MKLVVFGWVVSTVELRVISRQAPMNEPVDRESHAFVVGQQCFSPKEGEVLYQYFVH